MGVTVNTQAELDAALAASEPTIYIESPAGVWLSVRDSGSSHVEAWGSSHVVAWDSSHVVAWDSSHVVARGSSHVVAWGSSHVVAWGSSHVVARGSSHVVAWGSSHVEAWGSSHVEAWGSSHVEAWGSSHVEAWDSSHVEAWGSSHVEAGACVAVHLYSQRVTLSGGVVIDMTAVDESDPQTWCELHGATITDGIVTLYKATDGTLTAGQSYTPVTYTVGETVEVADWRDDNSCGGGLHLGPTASHATDYRRDAKRWVRCEVPLADLRPILGGTAKVKVRACRVVAEVDRWGKEIAS